jgi:4-hydroxythreonine-4-phosphate dehydrogenase
MQSGRHPVIAVTAGDPGGIGPEIVAHLFAAFTPEESTAVVIGSRRVLEPWAKRFSWEPRRSLREDELGDSRAIDAQVLLLPLPCEADFAIGEDSPGGGRHAGEAIEEACRLAAEGAIDAIVTAPISKKSLNMAGYPFPGHTEMLASRFGVENCEMMMVYRDLRIVPMTRHLPLSEVSSRITEERAMQCLETVNRSLEELFEIEKPRIAFAALNPHAGDKGLIGEEEVTVVAPAVAKARERGIDVVGPIPGDVVFQSIRAGGFDAYIAMYHDQGLIPFKMVAGKKGVNLTVGLPVIRTSVDHGVAFDIAGKGEADVTSLKEAYLLAEKLAGKVSARN